MSFLDPSESVIILPRFAWIAFGLRSLCALTGAFPLAKDHLWCRVAGALLTGGHNVKNFQPKQAS